MGRKSALFKILPRISAPDFLLIIGVSYVPIDEIKKKSPPKHPINEIRRLLVKIPVSHREG